jgi:hypothetical protein
MTAACPFRARARGTANFANFRAVFNQISGFASLAGGAGRIHIWDNRPHRGGVR